jgi:hypothetical protein
MITYMKLSEKQTEFLAMTGLSVEEFNALLPTFKKVAGESKVTLEGKTRKRKTAIYKNAPIASEADQLLFILIYMKQYMTQTALGVLFGISQPKANMLIHYFIPILSSALNELGDIPCRNMKHIKYFKEEEGSAYCHDGTERHVSRPKNSIRQKENYSGKKKLIQ